jgi:hypothetical protein
MCSGQVVRQAWIPFLLLPWGHLWVSNRCRLYRWILQRNCGSVIKMAVSRSATFLVSFSTSLNLVGQCKANSLSIFCNPRNKFVLPVTGIKNYVFIKCCVIYWAELFSLIQFCWQIFNSSFIGWLERILTMVYVFCLPHTRRWIKSKTSPIARYFKFYCPVALQILSDLTFDPRNVVGNTLPTVDWEIWQWWMTEWSFTSPDITSASFRCVRRKDTFVIKVLIILLPEKFRMVLVYYKSISGPIIIQTDFAV